MIDKEKVIKGLKCCCGNGGNGMCFHGCPYFERSKDICDCTSQLALEALELLKEQEPVLLKNQHKPGGHFINANSPWISKCPRCGKKIEGRQTRFCKYCGQAVKWE